MEQELGQIYEAKLDEDQEISVNQQKTEILEDITFNPKHFTDEMIFQSKIFSNIF